MSILKTPNLPQNKVRYVLISKNAVSTQNALKNFGIASILTDECLFYDKPVQTHPDMSFVHLNDNNCIVQASQSELVKKLTNIGFIVTCSKNEYNCFYPNDIGLNCVLLNNYLIGRADKLDQVLLEYCENKNIEILNVNQGYAKCSICVVDKNSIITEDESIYRVLKNKFDVLKIDSGYITLNGYNYGFFGGATGLLGKNVLAINGELKYHKNKNQILAFLKERSIEILELKSGEPEDIGSILPLTEIK